MCRNSINRGGETTCVVWEHPEGASRYGLYNMSGNVRERCGDWHHENVYRRYAAGDLRPFVVRPESGSGRVWRGGSWDFDSPRYFRCANRDDHAPGDRTFNLLGFRCARGL